MARAFVIIVMFYFFTVALFALLSISLVFMRARSLSFALKGIAVFCLFPILILTKDGRQKLQNITNF